MKREFLGAMFFLGAAAVLAITACKPAESEGDGCSSDADCKGDRVCVDGECKTAGSGGTGGGGAGGGGCVAPGKACGGTSDCCQSGDTVGPYGAACIGSDQTCHAKCYAHGECKSGCCAGVQGEEYGVCAGAEQCQTSCRDPGESCSATSECCQSGDTVGPYGAVCISDDGACHPKCYSNSSCKSGCCAAIQGESYGVCASAVHCG